MGQSGEKLTMSVVSAVLVSRRPVGAALQEEEDRMHVSILPLFYDYHTIVAPVIWINSDYYT